MFSRDHRGRVVVTIEDPEGGLSMRITNGATYRFRGADYLATVEDSELSAGTLACFQRHPIHQEDDEPSLFLDRQDGSLCDDTGAAVGDYNELEPLDD